MPLALALALLLAQALVRARAEAALSCEEAASAPLVALERPCTAAAGASHFVCDQRLPLARHQNDAQTLTAFSVLARAPARLAPPAGDLAFCVGLEELLKSDIFSTEGFYLDQRNTFARDVAVGVVVVDARCWGAGAGECPVNVSLREDLLTLPPFRETPDVGAFWQWRGLAALRADVDWLQSLHADGNGLKLPAGVLLGLRGTSLRYLALRNALNCHHTQTLRDLPLLRALELSQSSLHSFSPDSFIGTPNIEHLELNGNKFNRTPAGIRNLKKLSTLRIESNRLEFSLQPEVLEELSELQILSFSGTRIVNWTGEFPTLPALQNLSFAACGLTHLNTTFRLPALEELRLQENGLRYVSLAAFVQLPRLRHLDLSSNRLAQWPQLARARLASLSLRNNSLATLAALGRQGASVQRLDLSRNAIAQWTDGAAFGEPAWARSVNLSANSILWASAPMLSALGALREVDLGGNALDCSDCRTGALQAWLRRTRTRVLRLGAAQPLLCALPAALRGRPVLRAPFDAAACRDPRPRLWLGLGLPLAALVAAAAGGAALAFRFRTEVAYLAHLVRVRSTARAASRHPHTGPGPSNTYDAFVCYSGKDRNFVLRRLVRALERPPDCFRLCLYDRDFRLGTHIVSNIVDAIDCSSKVVVVLTQHFIASKWCQWELEMAQHKLFSEDREFLVLLELEPLERRRLPRLLRFLLDTRPVVRWPRPESAPAVKAAAAELRRALGPSLRRRQQPDERTPLLCEAQPAARL
ncbi:hypothetical protein R5R35_000031 [Gryllus longicercus]|uniref:TIR domain-containing protein n=1 Tax=Gryllus longicercus TaxID=2509291 RepID=A0AAN9Z572_9ORTH